MSFIIKQEAGFQKFEPQFQEVAAKLSDLQHCYTTAKESALITRMEMIGLAETQKAKYPQRSAEHKYILAGYENLGWTTGVMRSKCYQAYMFRESLLNKGVDDYAKLALASTFTQLYELSRTEGQTTTIYCAAQYLKKTGKVPTKAMINGHAGGYFSDAFVSKGSLQSGKSKDKVEKPEPIVQTMNTEPNTDGVVTHNIVDITSTATEIETETITQEAHMSPIQLIGFLERYIKANQETWSDREKSHIAVAGNVLYQSIGRKPLIITH